MTSYDDIFLINSLSNDGMMVLYLVFFNGYFIYFYSVFLVDEIFDGFLLESFEWGMGVEHFDFVRES
jgi:hypothetical protein